MHSRTSSPRNGRGHDLPSPKRTLVVHLAVKKLPRPTGTDVYAGTAALVSFGDVRARRLITLNSREARK